MLQQISQLTDEKLIMPEYGRNVQRMVEHALTITDREERNRCVRTIMQTMENLFPYLKTEEARHKMYDHLAIMSQFRLDIDYPFDRPTPEELLYKPEKLPYNTVSPLRYRHYGRIVQKMIQEAVRETDRDKQKFLILRIAQRMRQNYLVWNKDQADEQHIKADIYNLSNGQLDCNFPEFAQVYSKPVAQPNNPSGTGRKHRKKNKR